MKRAFKWVFKGAVFVAIVPLVYLAAAWIGAYVVWTPVPLENNAPKRHRIYLLSSLLHADIAIEATPATLERFAHLRNTAVPMDHPNLRALVFGWGSKAFYTTAGTYSDISAKAVFTAVTGDDSVMRVVGYGDVSKDPDAFAIDLTASQFEKLLRQIENGFAKNVEGERVFMPDVSIGQGDAFFAGTGHFNIFYPCNQWVRDALVQSGLTLGRWTPTTYSLLASLKAHNQLSGTVQP